MTAYNTYQYLYVKYFTWELPASGCSPKTPIEILRVTRVANAVRRASRRASRRDRRMFIAAWLDGLSSSLNIMFLVALARNGA